MAYLLKLIHPEVPSSDARGLDVTAGTVLPCCLICIGALARSGINHKLARDSSCDPEAGTELSLCYTCSSVVAPGHTRATLRLAGLQPQAAGAVHQVPEAQAIHQLETQ